MTSPAADGAGAAYARLHADAVRLLTAWTAPDAQQDDLREQLLDHLARHPDGVARSGPPAHLTASALLLSEDGEHVLLTLHRKARRWFQMGGHLEPGDRTVHAAAEREAREESGVPGVRLLGVPVQLDRHRLEGSFGRCREHLDVRFAGVLPRTARYAVSQESEDVAWWPVRGLPEQTAAELRPLVKAAQDALGRC